MDIRGTRWRKHGLDRTYLADEAGTPLGWIDNKTGALSVGAEEHRAALEAWATGNAVAASSPEDPPGRAPTPASGEVASPAPDNPAQVETHPDVQAVSDWVDLAANRPGQAARRQAEAHLAEMRGRSRIMTALVRALDINSDERAWRVGAKAEESIGSRLDKLVEHGWHVLHAVPIGSKGSDIDHLLIGPGGVWTVNTKNHPGKRI